MTAEYKKVLDVLNDEDTILVILVGFASSAWTFLIDFDYLGFLPPALAILYLIIKVFTAIIECKIKRNEFNQDNENKNQL